jgi:type III pantothenate kinase
VSSKRGGLATVKQAVLLIDIGNTRVKWARFDGRKLGPLHAEAHTGWGGLDYARQVIGSAGDVQRIVVSSVAGDRVNRSVSLAARSARAPTPEFVTSQKRGGGVTVGYVEPWRLGVDRFIGAIGAFHLAKGKPVVVVGVGTALTVDLIDPKGRHRGGAIIPAPTLMMDTLLNNTDGIRRRAQGGADPGKTLFGRSTRAGIMQGSRYAAAAFIDRSVEEAHNVIGGGRPLLLLTGGGAPSVQPLLKSACRSVPDLVLQGLAVLSAEPSARAAEPTSRTAGRKKSAV